MPDVYLNVYDSERPEVFFMGTQNQTVGPDDDVRTRSDSGWNVPEPEIGIVLYRGEPNGYTIENIEEIPTVEGIDIGFLGPYDLSQSLAIPGQVTHKRVEEMMTKVCELADKTDTVVGTFADSPEIANKWIAAGAHYAALGVKVRMFTEHLASVTNAVDTESEWALLITV